jgi:hypothetical protein
MMVLKNTGRLLAGLAVILSLGIAGCSNDGPNDAPFNPAGTSQDLDAAQGAFESPLFQSFAAIGGDIDAVVTTPVSAAIGQVRGGLIGDARQYATRLTRMLPGTGAGAAAAVAAIPPAALGKTYEYSIAEDRYVESSRAGAPANGVRFLLYAINPVTGRPVSPLNEVGYADVRDLSGGSTRSARVVVVSSAGVTYLDYTVGASANTSATGGTINIGGFITDGTTRAEFDLDNTVTATSGGGARLDLDYQLDVPSRDVSLDFTMVFDGDETPTAELDLTVSGPNGSVTLKGDFSFDQGGALQVLVNGTLFANITSDPGQELVVTGANGQALTEAETEALYDVFDVFAESFDVFLDLLDPVDSMFNS